MCVCSQVQSSTLKVGFKVLGCVARMRCKLSSPDQDQGGDMSKFVTFISLCVALRSHVRPLTHTTPLDHTTHTTHTQHIQHIQHHPLISYEGTFSSYFLGARLGDDSPLDDKGKPTRPVQVIYIYISAGLMVWGLWFFYISPIFYYFYYTILLVSVLCLISCFMRSGALDSSGVLLSYYVLPPAPHLTTVILTSTLFQTHKHINI